MNIACTLRNTLIASLLVTLGACSSSESETTPANDTADAGSPAPLGPLVPMEETPLSDPQSSPAAEQEPPVSQEQEPPPADEPATGSPAPADPAPSEPAEIPGNTPEQDPAPGNTPEQSPTPGNSPEVEPAPVGGEPAIDESANPVSVLVPPVVPGSDLDRLVQGLTRQVALTLLNLNQLIFSTGGELLTAQQEACLGPFEEGFGVALASIDCGNLRLATGNNPMRVGVASFYNTPECLNALLIQSSEGCVLERVSLTVGADWDASAGGAPTLLFPGALLDYAIGDTFLHVDNDPEVLGGFFSCDVNLENVDITSEFSAANCDNTVKIVADQIEKMQSL